MVGLTIMPCGVNHSWCVGQDKLARATRSDQAPISPMLDRLPFELVHGIPVIQVTVNKSENESFIVDSGSPVTFIDLGVARRLKIPLVSESTQVITLQGTGFSSGVKTLDAKPVKISFGRYYVKGDVLAVDLDAYGKTLGIPLAGVIGFDILRQMPTALDYSLKTFTILDPKKFKARDLDSVTSVEIDIGATEPVVEGHLEAGGRVCGIARVLIDTGNDSSAVILPRFATEHELGELTGWLPIRLRGMDGVADGSRGVSGFITLGGRRFPTDAMVMTTSTVGLANSAKYDVLMGNPAFGGSIVLFDVKHGHIYLTADR